ncbi:hypothetical protein HDV01_005576 [Terramyces sp. JEL0728]|nr:hypothetical protein HDV01_005576 [Terramyces sp. JEL0728]
MKDVSPHIAQLWALMTNEERQPYEEQAYNELRLHHIMYDNISKIGRRVLKKYNLSKDEIVRERLKLGIPVEAADIVNANLPVNRMAMKPLNTANGFILPRTADLSQGYCLPLGQENLMFELVKGEERMICGPNYIQDYSQSAMPLNGDIHTLFPTNSYKDTMTDSNSLMTLLPQVNLSTANSDFWNLDQSNSNPFKHTQIENEATESEDQLQSIPQFNKPQRKKPKSNLQITVPEDKEMGVLSSSFARLSAGFDFHSFKTGWTPASATMSFFKSMF